MILFYYSAIKRRKFYTLAYLFLSVELASSNLALRKFSRQKKDMRVSLSHISVGKVKRTRFTIRDAPSIWRIEELEGGFNARNYFCFLIWAKCLWKRSLLLSASCQINNRTTPNHIAFNHSSWDLRLYEIFECRVRMKKLNTCERELMKLIIF